MIVTLLDELPVLDQDGTADLEDAALMGCLPVVSCFMHLSGFGA